MSVEVNQSLRSLLFVDALSMTYSYEPDGVLGWVDMVDDPVISYSQTQQAS